MGMVLRILAALVVLAVVPAQAAERWPSSVCAAIARDEKIVTELWRDHPWERALSRQSDLVMLQERCGVDVRAKLAADEAVTPPKLRGVATSISPQRRSTLCNTVKVGDEMSVTRCD